MGSHHPIRKVVTPEPPVIPDRLYFRIGDVARLCEVPAYVLRFWETEFPNLKPNKGGTGQRLYRKRDVEIALRIKSLLYDQGYTIPGARQVLKAEAKGEEVASAPVSGAQPDAQSGESLGGDRGEAIRRLRQQQAPLRELRDDLLAVIAMLRAPVPHGDSAAAIEPSAAKPLRPRLLLEPRPSQRTTPLPPKPGSTHLQQRDLFAFDSPESAG